jgi:hypothetical protein
MKRKLIVQEFDWILIFILRSENDITNGFSRYYIYIAAMFSLFSTKN